MVKHIILSVFGGLLYYLIELIWRCYSHWSMLIVGGICFLLIGLINEFLTWDTPLWKQCGIATVIITVMEFLAGCIINLWIGWRVWDYSNMPLNLLGQICVPFVALWYSLSVVGIILDDVLRWKLFGEEKPRYRLF